MIVMNTHTRGKPTRVKRTYTLSRSSVDAVKEMAEEYHVAGSQDAVVDQAISELHRRVRDARDAELWARAAEDPAFVTEMREIERGLAADDRRAWSL